MNMLRRFMAEASRIYEVRTGTAITDALQITQPRDAYEFLRTEMEDLSQEQFRTIQLNTKNRIVSSTLLYQGTLNMTTLRVSEVFRDAIIDSASGIVLCHNHPSGDPTPSPEDVALTHEIVRAGDLLDIEILDHIVIGKGNFSSLREMGMGFNRNPRTNVRE